MLTCDSKFVESEKLSPFLKKEETSLTYNSNLTYKSKNYFCLYDRPRANYMGNGMLGKIQKVA